MGGWIDFDGKSGRFRPGTDLFLSLLLYFYTDLAEIWLGGQILSAYFKSDVIF